MFSEVYDSNNRQFSLYITIKCDGKKKFRVIADDYGKPNSQYANRDVIVSGEKTIFISFPVSPKKIGLEIFNIADPNDNSFTVKVQAKPLKTYNIWMDSDTKDFLTLAINFAQRSGFEKASDNGILWKTDDDKFRIKYFNVISDVKTGRVYNTPARIGHNSGIIEVAKSKFDKYTVPMRLIILLHEFSHKYKNPKMGLEISNEVGADINALYIYLGLGFSKIDAICVFANVFLKAQTKGNIDRMRKIMDYIQRFENGEFAKRNAVPENVL
jgi:hypothetical protein